VSAAPTRSVFVGASPRQLRALHATAARLGLAEQFGVGVHEAVRIVANVASLAELSSTAAARLLSKLNADRGEYKPPKYQRRPRATPGTLRPGTVQQRAAITAIAFNELGWTAEGLADWLRERHQIISLAGQVLSTKTLSAVVTELQQIAFKTAARRMGVRR
jgi:hypothetical protein